jgi:serine protease AprX
MKLTKRISAGTWLMAIALWLMALVMPAYNEPSKVSVIVFLKYQPFLEFAKQVKEQYEPQIAVFENQIQTINKQYLKREPSKEDKNIKYELTPEDKRTMDFASVRIKNLTIDMRQEIVRRTENAVAPMQRVLSRDIQRLGGTVNYTYIVFNAVAALVPENKINELKNNPQVDRVENDYKLQGQLNTSTHSMKVDTFWQSGYTGGPNVGPWLAVLDCGIAWAHPALNTHSHKDSVFHQTAKTAGNYSDFSTSTDDYQGHGTFVAGTIWSKGCNTEQNWTENKGIAYGDDHCINAKAGYKATDGLSWMYWSDAMKAAEWAINYSGVWADVVNLSYGGKVDVDDTTYSRFWDAVVDGELVCVTLSAGNDSAGTNKISNPGISYNAITVGAMADCDDTARSNDYIAIYSSRGPTSGGRKKPDLVAVGGDSAYPIWSCEAAWDSSGFLDFWKNWGTSFAAPQVGAAATLLGEIFGYNPNPKVFKALLLNNASDLGTTGWNNDYGWGYMDLRKTYIHRWDWFRYKVKPCSSQFYVGKMYTGDKATLVWNRHATYIAGENPTTYYKLNNLDLMVYRKSDQTLLYSSASTIDNVEQVTATADDSVVIKVVADTSYNPGISFEEEYALATEEGFTGNTYLKEFNQIIFFNPSPGNSYPSATPIHIGKVIMNLSPNLAMAASVCSLRCAPGMSIVSGSNPQAVPPIQPGASDTAEWEVIATLPGVYPITVKDWNYSYGVLLQDSATDTILIGNAGSVGDTSGAPGAHVVVPLFTTNYQAINGMVIPLEYNTGPLDVDSVHVDMLQFPATWVSNVTVNEAGGTILISLTGPIPLPAGSRNIANIYFHISGNASPQTVVIDTCIIGTNVFTFIGTTNNPVFGRGSVMILDTFAPPIPILRAPANSSIISERQPTFVWSSSAGTGGSYGLQFDDNSGFTSPVTISTPDTFCQVPDTLPLSDTTYYWRVRAKDAVGNPSLYSGYWSFTVDANAPNAPALVAPLDSSVIASNPPTFQWSAVTMFGKNNSDLAPVEMDVPTTSITYTLQYATAPDFYTGFVTASGLTSTTYTPVAALASGTYYWRVEAVDGAGNRSGYRGLPFSFIVSGTPSSGWQTMASLLTATSGKNPKSGSCLAALDSNIYFLKASNTQDFARFTPNATTGTWASLETIPLGTKATFDGKKPKKGASITAYDKSVYALRGNNTPGFWKYIVSPAESSGWKKLTNIPTGAKNPKDASGLVAVSKGGAPYIFVMKGSKTDEFYLYDIAANTWLPKLTSPSAGTSTKIGYKKGSCLCYDDANTIYVMKGGYGDFFKYDLNAGTWTELRRYDAKLFTSREGKKKKVGEGSGLEYFNNAVYLMKGGNTYEIWKYDITANNWVQMNELWDIPEGGGKKVKGGGCMTQLGSDFYAAKGANTSEFYKHTPPFAAIAIIPNPKTTNDATMSKDLTINKFKLTIVPNPASNATAISYNLPVVSPVSISLYNVTGKFVKSFINSTPTRNGLLLIDVKALPSGVYVLQFSSGDIRVTRKIVLEK